ncbi:MAG: hypothetical protein FJW38_00970 [Acidobacteria bacterium]|nr:hypothetical protein [Acidobacteriota bacterium]
MVASRIAAGLILAILLYTVLPGTFLFDDYSLFGEAPAIAPWLQPRPLTYFTFAFDKALWGQNALGFRLTNLLIHLAAAYMLYRIARRFFDERVGLAAASIFAIHPLTAEPVFYVFARSSSLAALLCFVALELWLRERRWLSVVAYAAALSAKEECAAFPVFLVLFGPGWRQIGAMAAFTIAAGARVLYSTSVIAGAGSGFGQPASPLEYFVTQGGALAGYAWRVVAPFGISIDPATPGSWWWVWIVVAAFVGFVLWKRVAVTHPLFWCLAAILLILPSSSILPAADAVAYRRMYLPMACVAIALAIRVPSCVWAFIAFAAMQSAQWRTEQAAWQNAHGLAPDKIRPYIQLARTYPPREALTLLRQAKEKAPRDAEVALHLGRVHLEAGDAANALSEFGRALAIEPNQARHMQNRGVALLVLGQRDAAIADFERAIERDPCLAIARENLQTLGVPVRSNCR